jgi:hypothetical protein
MTEDERMQNDNCVYFMQNRNDKCSERRLGAVAVRFRRVEPALCAGAFRVGPALSIGAFSRL